MSAKTSPARKVTVSLPVSLIDFADQEAVRLNISRSKLIARALSEIRIAEEERLAAEGYRFYADEASEFAEASSRVTAEAWEHAS